MIRLCKNWKELWVSILIFFYLRGDWHETSSLSADFAISLINSLWHNSRRPCDERSWHLQEEFRASFNLVACNVDGQARWNPIPTPTFPSHLGGVALLLGHVFEKLTSIVPLTDDGRSMIYGPQALRSNMTCKESILVFVPIFFVDIEKPLTAIGL